MAVSKSHWFSPVQKHVISKTGLFSDIAELLLLLYYIFMVRLNFNQSLLGIVQVCSIVPKIENFSNLSVNIYKFDESDYE